MPGSPVQFGNLSARYLVRSGRAFVAVGVLLGTVGITVLAIPLFNLLSLALSGTRLVQYASSMLGAQLVVHAVVFVLLALPAAFLIHQGRKRVRFGSK